MSFFQGVNPHTVSHASDGFKGFRLGDNHAYISKVEEKTSKNGNPMLEITFSDENGASILYWIVDGEYKLSKLKQLYQAFEINIGEINTQKWLGKWGIVVCRDGKPHDGKIYKEVHFVRPASGNIPQNSTPQNQPASFGGGFPQDHTNEFQNDIPF